MRVFLIAIITSLATPLFAYDGIVEPQIFTIAELELINGETISPVSVVYQTYGTLDPDGRNGILILHGMALRMPRVDIRRTVHGAIGTNSSAPEKHLIQTSTL
jgi:hypothetical protein